MNAQLTRRTPLLLLVLALALLLAGETASAAPADATAAANKTKVCKQRKGESKRKWQKRCGCKKPRRGESRARFKKRCVPYRRPAATAPPAPGTTPGSTTTPAGPQPLSGQAAIDHVRSAMSGMRMSRVACSGTACASSITEHVDFCRDGTTFRGRRTTQGYSGYVYEVNFAGTWSVLEAGVNAERTLAEAKVNSQVTQASGNDDPPASGDGILTFVGSNQVFLNRQTEYTRGQGAC